MTNSSLVTYNPISPNNPEKRTHCVVGQHSVEKFANKTRKADYSFAVGFYGNSLIVQCFPKGYMSS